MPGFVRNKKDEKKWTHAKEVSDAIRKKKPEKKGSNRYALANWIYHHKLSKAEKQSEDSKKDATEMYEVYYLGKTGKKILCQKFDNQAEANEQLKELRKLYGKYIKAGVRAIPVTAFDRSVSNAKNRITQRKKDLG